MFVDTPQPVCLCLKQQGSQNQLWRWRQGARGHNCSWAWDSNTCKNKWLWVWLSWLRACLVCLSKLWVQSQACPACAYKQRSTSTYLRAIQVRHPTRDRHQGLLHFYCVLILLYLTASGKWKVTLLNSVFTSTWLNFWVLVIQKHPKKHRIDTCAQERLAITVSSGLLMNNCLILLIIEHRNSWKLKMFSPPHTAFLKSRLRKLRKQCSWGH